MAFIFLILAIWQLVEGNYGWAAVWFALFLLFKD